jgi:hypothetical protein
MTATPAEIAAALITDETPRPDGWHNRERVAFVLSTFGADTIDFEQVFDFGAVLECYNPQVIEAWRQLAILQSFYAEALYIYQWIDEEDHYAISNYLRCVIQHIDWHHHCLFTGEDKTLVIIPD